MRIAIAYSTKDQVELTEQTLPAFLQHDKFDCLWADGSKTPEGQSFFERNAVGRTIAYPDVRGGADAAIAFKLSKMLASTENYTHIGLLENDCLLDEDWFKPTLELFEKGKVDGLEVGAVSARLLYVDRVLIQREGYAVMHNLGAGMVIFTRDAAEIVLRSFRTHWWPDNRRLFAALSGIDLATYACFRGQEQFVTSDWGWDAQLAARGLASLALTPAKCRMIGQNPPLAEQGLELTTKCGRNFGPQEASFELFKETTWRLRNGSKIDLLPAVHREGNGQLFFPHQLGALNARLSAGPDVKHNWKLQWSQGWGPFTYRAGEGGASLSMRISGTCSVLASGGLAGAKISVEDQRSGFKFEPQLPPSGEIANINVPGGPIPRTVMVKVSEGGLFCGLSTTDVQMIDENWRFDWNQLPEAE